MGRRRWNRCAGMLALVWALAGATARANDPAPTAPDGLYYVRDGVVLRFARQPNGTVTCEPVWQPTSSTPGWDFRVKDFVVTLDPEGPLIAFRTEEPRGASGGEPFGWDARWRLAPSDAPGAWDALSPRDAMQPTGLEGTFCESATPGPVREKLVPIEDERFLELLGATDAGDFAKARSIAAELCAAHPGNLYFRMARIDVAILEGDREGGRALLNSAVADWGESKRPLLRRMAKQYAMTLRAWDAETEGRNLATTVGALRDTPGPEQVRTAIERLRIAGFGDIYWQCDAPCFLPPRMGVPNFLGIQVLCKTERVAADFELIDGNTQGAVGRLLGFCRLGQMMQRDAHGLIDRLIGVAVSQIAIAGLETACLDGARTVEDIDAFWPSLNEAARMDRANRIVDAERQNELPPDGNLCEARVRQTAMQARLRLLHSAVAARRDILEGRAPSLDRPPAILEGAYDRDLFAQGQQTVRLASMGEEKWDWRLYSVGPDGIDGGAEITYDPTNGSISGGDMWVRVARDRTYPFPAGGLKARTADEVQAAFPNGLPPDPFADTRWLTYTVTNESPPRIVSFGPDVDQFMWYGMQGGQGGAARALAPGGVWSSGNIPDAPAYDPTNGAVSRGDIWMKVAAP